MQQLKFEKTDGVGFNLFISALFFIASAVFGIIGFINITTVSNVKEFVGGDAYNYIMHFSKYNGFLLVSVVLALFGILTALYSIYLMLSAFANFYSSTLNQPTNANGEEIEGK